MCYKNIHGTSAIQKVLSLSMKEVGPENDFVKLHTMTACKTVIILKSFVFFFSMQVQPRLAVRGV